MTTQKSTSNIINATLRSFGERATSTLQIKLPNTLVEKLKNSKIEIIDYSVLIPDTSSIFIVKDNQDIISYMFKTQTPDGLKHAFKEIYNRFLSMEKNETHSRLQIHDGESTPNP